MSVIGDYNTAVTAAQFRDACWSGKIDIVRQYIDEGGDVNIVGRYITALMGAVNNNHTGIIKELIDAGADVNLRNKNGWTALMLASLYGAIECVRTLLAAGAYVNIQNNQGRSALDIALTSKQYDSAGVLVEAGADIYARDKFGIQAINKCSNKRVKEKLVKMFEQHVNTVMKSNNKPIMTVGFDVER